MTRNVFGLLCSCPRCVGGRTYVRISDYLADHNGAADVLESEVELVRPRHPGAFGISYVGRQA